MSITGFDKQDVEEELDHSRLFYVALCPFEAKSVILDTVREAVNAMIEKLESGDVGGFPMELWPKDREIHEELSPEEQASCEAEWMAILKSIRDAITLYNTGLDDTLTIDESIAEDNKRNAGVQEAMLSVATWIHHLLI